MVYVRFSLWFTLIHTVAYAVAGMIALRVSGDIYEGKERLMTYLRDMSDPGERGHVEKWSILAQVPRGLLMSVVLYPILGAMGEMPLGLRFAFLSGLMFVYTHLSAAAPCADNIEGFVYMKDAFFRRSSFLKFQMEMVMYSVLFGFAAGSLLF